jgi:hypothetical protein
MVFKEITRSIFSIFHKIEKWSGSNGEKTYSAAQIEKSADFEEIHSVWDYLEFRANTQAFHLSSVLGFDEWVDMAEIRRRINALFGIEYKNERSLYPYLKTLTDIGIMESTSIGGRMQWRKKDLLVKISKKEGEKQGVVVEAIARKKTEKEER